MENLETKHKATIRCGRVFALSFCSYSFEYISVKAKDEVAAESERLRRRDWMKKGRLPVKENDFDVDVFSILVKEILKKVRHWLVGDVSADDYVPIVGVGRKDIDWFCYLLLGTWHHHNTRQMDKTTKIYGWRMIIICKPKNMILSWRFKVVFDYWRICFVTYVWIEKTMIRFFFVKNWVKFCLTEEAEIKSEKLNYSGGKTNENHPGGCGYGSIRAKLHYTIWLGLQFRKKPVQRTTTPIINLKKKTMIE